jgi:hypothetical protein
MASSYETASTVRDPISRALPDGTMRTSITFGSKYRKASRGDLGSVLADSDPHAGPVIAFENREGWGLDRRLAAVATVSFVDRSCNRQQSAPYAALGRPSAGAWPILLLASLIADITRFVSVW